MSKPLQKHVKYPAALVEIRLTLTDRGERTPTAQLRYVKKNVIRGYMRWEHRAHPHRRRVVITQVAESA
jgi:hypothetical protein